MQLSCKDDPLGRRDSTCLAFDKVHITATNTIETSPTSPETCGLEMKQLRDTVSGACG
jgi:hypothetical protein